MSLILAKKIAWHILLSQGLGFEECRQAVKSFYSKSRAINDGPVVDHLKKSPSVYNMMMDNSLISKFQNSFTSWIQKNKFNTCSGLELFEPDISQGSTQSFDSFFLRHPDKKHKFFLGEYLYHIVVKKNLGQKWSFILDHTELSKGDALILSVPFCDTGNAPKQLDQILTHCTEQKIPVLLDLSYYTISHGINIDLNFDCIDTVSFSLSKTFPVAYARIGMRYTRKESMDGQKLHSNINYDNRISAGIGLHVIEKFPSDYVVNKYLDLYHKVAAKLDLDASQTMIFADGTNDWSSYGRKELLTAYGLEDDSKFYKNRICLTELLENKQLIEEFLHD